MASPMFSLVGNEHTLQIAGVRFLGINAENGRKLLFTVALLIVLYLLNKLLWQYLKKPGHR